ncbi:capsule biosynthesis protein CapA [Rhodovulum sp. DZ06]|uniref:capsular polysaccharide export protein, LipB/KpsS family n=1 Tax=Rhodovulum sp. DZ06 TaxID=3425126 RepID=UPI003D3546BF
MEGSELRRRMDAAAAEPGAGAGAPSPAPPHGAPPGMGVRDALRRLGRAPRTGAPLRTPSGLAGGEPIAIMPLDRAAPRAAAHAASAARAAAPEARLRGPASGPPPPPPPTPPRAATGRRGAPGAGDAEHRGDASGRSFLLLQGPHGPFLAELALALRARGADVARIAFNAGDAACWRLQGGADPGPLLRFDAPFAEFELRLGRWIRERAATDLVLYGDTRPFHAVARRLGRALGLRVHCFEEGYIRPRWITYERDGVNGNSNILKVPVEEMIRAVRAAGPAPEALFEDGWGAARAHALHGVRYHARVRLAAAAPWTRWPRQAPHMPLTGWCEARAYLRRGLTWPLMAHRARRALAPLLAPDAPGHHLALLQLGADSSLRAHSRFPDVAAVVERIVADYAAAEGGLSGLPLVFKAHPFETGRERLARAAARAARRHGVAGRVVFVERGPLGPMLDKAVSAVTVNSTAAQAALLRGLPVRAMGEAVFVRPGLVSTQPPAAFFAAPLAPDMEAVRAFRRFLVASSQFEGDFYTPEGRARAIGPVIEAMLARRDPYARALAR